MIDIGARVVEELNASAQSDLSRIVQGFRGLLSIPIGFQQVRRHGRLWIEPSPAHPSANLLQELNGRLAEYRLWPEVKRSENGGWEIVWRGRKENYALGWIVELAFQDELRRMRTCPECKQWFMAEKLDQVYCGTSCRRRKDRLLPKNRKANAIYQRNYRKQTKLRNEIEDLWAQMQTVKTSEKQPIEKKIKGLEKQYRSLKRRSDAKD